MIFDPVIFAAVMRNHFPKMTPEEIQAISDRAQYLITFFSGFIEGRRSTVPQQLQNLEASANYVALSYMVATMDKTGSKVYMGGLGDAAVRAVQPSPAGGMPAAAPAAAPVLKAVPPAPAPERAAPAPTEENPFPFVPPVRLD